MKHNLTDFYSAFESYKRLQPTLQPKTTNSNAAAQISALKWSNEHQDTIEDTLKHILPQGSGFDFAWNIELSDTITLESAYHLMDSNGYYCGNLPFIIGMI